MCVGCGTQGGPRCPSPLPPAGPGGSPWRGGRGRRCGGALLGGGWVLTAASCFIGAQDPEAWEAELWGEGLDGSPASSPSPSPSSNPSPPSGSAPYLGPSPSSSHSPSPGPSPTLSPSPNASSGPSPTLNPSPLSSHTPSSSPSPSSGPSPSSNPSPSPSHAHSPDSSPALNSSASPSPSSGPAPSPSPAPSFRGSRLHLHGAFVGAEPGRGEGRGPDLALLQLRPSPTWGPHLRPLCAPYREHLDTAGAALGAPGHTCWAVLRRTGDLSDPARLRPVQVTPEPCPENPENPESAGNSPGNPQKFCVRPAAGEGPWQADPGSPLACERHGLWFLLGVASGGGRGRNPEFSALPPHERWVSGVARQVLFAETPPDPRELQRQERRGDPQGDPETAGDPRSLPRIWGDTGILGDPEIWGGPGFGGSWNGTGSS